MTLESGERRACVIHLPATVTNVSQITADQMKEDHFAIDECHFRYSTDKVVRSSTRVKCVTPTASVDEHWPNNNSFDSFPLTRDRYQIGNERRLMADFLRRCAFLIGSFDEFSLVEAQREKERKFSLSLPLCVSNYLLIRD